MRVATRSRGTSGGGFVASAALALLGASLAFGATGISDTVVLVEAHGGGGSAVFALSLTGANYDPIERTASWNRTTPMNLVNPLNGQTVGVMRSCNVFVRHYPPRMTANIAFTAGSAATTFIVRSAHITFPVMDGSLAEGRATASVSAQDMNNDGVTLQAVGPAGTGIFLAQFNGEAPNGTTYASLVSSLFAGPGGVATAYQNDPDTGYRRVRSPVGDISSQLEFTLTPADRGSANVRWEVQGVPFPAGDCNCDGRLNNFDVDPFLFALIDPDMYEFTQPGCRWLNADINTDGLVDNFDIDEFAGLLP